MGLTVDLGDFYRLAAVDSLLVPLADRLRGLRPPALPFPIEALANAASCQQLSLTVWIRLVNLSATPAGVAPPGGAHAFPRP